MTNEVTGWPAATRCRAHAPSTLAASASRHSCGVSSRTGRSSKAPARCSTDTSGTPQAVGGPPHGRPHLRGVGDVGGLVTDLAEPSQPPERLDTGRGGTRVGQVPLPGVLGGQPGAADEQQPCAGLLQQVGGHLAADSAQTTTEQVETVGRVRCGPGRGIGQRGQPPHVPQAVAPGDLGVGREPGRLRQHRRRPVPGAPAGEVEMDAAQPRQFLAQRLEQRPGRGVRGRGPLLGRHGLGAGGHEQQVHRPLAAGPAGECLCQHQQLTRRFRGPRRPPRPPSRRGAPPCPASARPPPASPAPPRDPRPRRDVRGRRPRRSAQGPGPP